MTRFNFSESVTGRRLTVTKWPTSQLEGWAASQGRFMIISEMSEIGIIITTYHFGLQFISRLPLEKKSQAAAAGNR